MVRDAPSLHRTIGPYRRRVDHAESPSKRNPSSATLIAFSSLRRSREGADDPRGRESSCSGRPGTRSARGWPPSRSEDSSIVRRLELGVAWTPCGAPCSTTASTRCPTDAAVVQGPAIAGGSGLGQPLPVGDLAIATHERRFVYPEVRAADLVAAMVMPALMRQRWGWCVGGGCILVGWGGAGGGVGGVWWSWVVCVCWCGASWFGLVAGGVRGVGGSGNEIVICPVRGAGWLVAGGHGVAGVQEVSPSWYGVVA